MKATAILFAVLVACAFGVLAGATWVRLAPSDPARWHLGADLGATALSPDALRDGQITETSGGARLRLTRAGIPAQVLLARLDAIALATPRTKRLAGSPAEGRITWITRSVIWGFPDYTTAEARGDGATTTLTLIARQRFGLHDLGANARRLQDWRAALTP